MKPIIRTIETNQLYGNMSEIFVYFRFAAKVKI